MPFIQFQFRRGTASEWTSADPVLAAGEMGIETDTDQFKIGDGTSTWSVLSYGGIQGPAGSGGLSAVVDDTAPVLGGNLDVGSNSITSSIGNITLSPGMGSYVNISGFNYPNTGGTAGQVLSTDGMGNITWSSASGLASVSGDASPALGGDLRVAGYSIVSEASGNVVLAPDGTGKSRINRIVYNEPVQEPLYSGTYAPDASDGGVVIMTLSGNITINGFTNAIAGQSITMILKQDATGGRTLSSTAKFAGGEKTLSTDPNAVDILTMFYDGFDYWASLGKDFS